MTEENVAIVRRFFDLWGEGEWRQLELLSANLVYKPIAEMPDAGEYTGPDGFRRYVEDFFEGDWSDGISLGSTSLRAHADKVIVRAEFSGRGRTSGLDLSGRVFQVYTLRDGQITRIEDFLERADAVAAAAAQE